MKSFLLFLLIIVRPLSGIAASSFNYLDPSEILFGIEYTFQDRGMVDEPGRNTFETPHKRARFEILKKAYLTQLGVKEDSLKDYGRPEHKPGHAIHVPGDGTHVINMEPVTIEVNTPPKRLNEIEAAAKKIFFASSEANLVAYVNPAAERSGMGHIHIGAKTIGESPFFTHPLLLRNIMVFEHKHPSVLWGFAEAYDIDDINVQSGSGITNIETYHKPIQQRAFKKAVEKFDNWYAETQAKGGDLSDGLRQFLRFLKREQYPPSVDFFRHYRYINLEHLKWIAESSGPIDPKKSGKNTVEFRNLRPPKTPLHAVAHSELLLSMLDTLAAPGHFEEFVEISPAQYDLFHSATRVAADWELVKNRFTHFNPIWEDSLSEYVQLQLGKAPRLVQLPGNVVAESFPAYSPKESKGTKFEIRVPARAATTAPTLKFGLKEVGFDRVHLGGKDYWVSVIEKEQLDQLAEVDHAVLVNKRGCSKWYSQILK